MDSAAILFSSAAVVLLRYALGGQFTLASYLNLAFLTLLFLLVYALLGLYPGIGLHPVTELRKLSHGTTLSFLLVATATFFIRDAEAYSRAVVAGSWGACLLGVPVARMALRRLLANTSWWGEKVVILGSYQSALLLHDALINHRFLGFKPAGFFLLPSAAHHAPLDDPRVLGGIDSAEAASALNIRCALIALPERSASEIAHLTRRYASGFHRVIVISDLFNLASLEVTTVDLGGYLGVQFRHRLLSHTPRMVKRTIDVIASAAGLVLLAPFFLLAAFLVRVSTPGPAFYPHPRIGYGGRRFLAWKFRTMYQDADRILQRCLEQHPELLSEWEREHKLRDDPRTTPIGRFLRVTSLDELPQLWNVLKGEMSLIGPRPIVDSEIEKYGRQYELYKRVRPGMSGLWQVSGRNNTTYAERVRLDEYYVRNWSVWLDLHIIARTVGVVLSREGAY
ncbi:MAG: undecaprenyl-phosphate galactose phosphotransferase WbaP [Candidatus Solibacter sp.]|nr:undecaprenyl-phosphate galactose phosphotransferase WbaP [Candidatus Solibacter sp.]